MQNAPSSHSVKSVQQTKSDVITSKAASNDKTSSSTKKGEDTKKPADNTDHTTVSTSFCGCKQDKCDAFFDKLLRYLEKQSDIIAKCCTLRRGSQDKLTISQDSKKGKDSHRDDTKAPTRHPSPCKDDDEPTLHRRPSVETQKSLKAKGKDKNYPEEDSDFKLPLYKSQHDFEGGRQYKIGDKPCNIYVEVCACRKDVRKAHATRSSHKDNEPDEYSYKQRSATPPQRHPSGKSNEYGVECHGCEDKVSYFFKLAEEICQGYMKQCQEQENRARSNHSGRRHSREDFGNQAPSRPNQSQSRNEGNHDDYMRPEKLSNEHDRPHARPIAIEIDCMGTKEEIIVEPCLCVDSHHGRGKPTPTPSRVESHGPKKSCLEVFEERYGQMLRDLHAKLFPDAKQNPPPQGYPPQGYPPQGYPHPGHPNPYGDGAPQQQLPPQHAQPATPTEKQEPPKDQKQSDDDSSDDRKKKKKKKEDKRTKKKGSKGS